MFALVNWSSILTAHTVCQGLLLLWMWAVRLSCKLLGQGHVRERLKSSLGKFYGRYGDLIKHYKVPISTKCYMTFLDMIIYSDTLHWSDISLNRDIVTELDIIAVFDVVNLFREVSIRQLQRVRLDNRGRLLLRTPGPVPFGTCFCSYVEIIHSWTCHVYGPFEFRASFGTSILLVTFTTLTQIVHLDMIEQCHVVVCVLEFNFKLGWS